jgi:hypothetical protein
MIESTQGIKIKYRWSKKIQMLGVALFLVIGFLSLLQLMRIHRVIYRQILGIAIILYLFWLAYRNNLLKLLCAPFRLAFIIYPDGIKLGTKNLFLQWSDLKEIVVFKDMGKKHFGFRLKDDASVLQRSEVQKILHKDLTWEAFKMPFVTTYDSISMPIDEIIEMIHARYGIHIAYKLGEKT